MKRILTLAVAGVLALAVGAACRTQHLGSNTGDSYRNAFEDQRTSEPTPDDPAMSADDAKNVLRTHNAADGKKGAATMGGTSSGAPSVGSTSMSGGKWDGAQGNIQLEAK